ncbi:LOW QUALITY PROTEIN: WAS protein family homolog 2 [Rhopalosiphum padi]|uniref:LOW QUALITY PROTEIN: WAS protein family homolog 2 n=1 Tax=Rhopalosiphum padi TaxID=40932 RepID=UPI00298E18EC|nr:LOW QUALITY PROTEIN: WAS protein family homolog 2 [Rhopalosiphum padi]
MVQVNKEACIPLLPYDLGYEETILQLIKSLDCLDKVVECVYEHVKGNINSQKSEIVKLSEKLNNIANKVQQLSNTKKSIQVYSSSKYPATHLQKDYKYSYDLEIKSDITNNIQVAHQICVSNDPNDKLKFYHVNDENKKLSKNKDIIKMKGLGKLPDDVNYINSLLLFNSNENLYKNYVLFNPYKVKTTPTTKQVQKVQNINKPVFTLPLNDTENQFNYSYTPVYEEVPTIDVPADLPDLPGIAGDVLCFKNEEENICIPVVSNPSSVVDLPSFDELDEIKNNEIVPEKLIQTEQEIIKTAEPEELSTVVYIQNKNDHVENIDNSVKKEQKVNNTYNDNINTHSVLMDEIRNAGGLQKAKLRSVVDRKTDSETMPTGDGLMADLHKKLAMRRQGISGNNKQNDSSLEGVIYRMASTMLPPNLESESEADGDNDTEGDWDD